MTVKEWQQMMKDARDLWRAGKQSESLAAIESAILRIEAERSRDASEWEREQLLSLKASLLVEDPTRAHETATAYLELATTLRGQMRAYGRSVGFALAQASLSLFEQGKEDEAYGIAEDALALLGLHGDNSQAFQDVIARVRAFGEKRAREQKPVPSKRW